MVGGLNSKVFSRHGAPLFPSNRQKRLTRNYSWIKIGFFLLNSPFTLMQLSLIQVDTVRNIRQVKNRVLWIYESFPETTLNDKKLIQTYLSYFGNADTSYESITRAGRFHRAPHKKCMPTYCYKTRPCFLREGSEELEAAYRKEYSA